MLRPPEPPGKASGLMLLKTVRENPRAVPRVCNTAAGPANFHTGGGGQAAEGLFAFCGPTWSVSQPENRSPGLG